MTDEALDKRASRTACKTLDEITPGDQPEAGGKAFNCVRLELRRVCALTSRAAADFMRSMGHHDEIQPADEIVSGPPLRQLLPRVRMTVRRLKWQYVRREECRSDLTRVIAHLRNSCHEF